MNGARNTFDRKEDLPRPQRNGECAYVDVGDGWYEVYEVIAGVWCYTRRVYPAMMD